MGKDTKIEWTATHHADGTITPGHTWNPWQGCHKVSAGCKSCYMFREKTRYGQEPNVVVRSKPATFNAPLKWHEPARVFTCSWSDFFIEEADAWRDEAWDIIRRTPHLTYQILTKRPERMWMYGNHLPPDWGAGWPNVWLGVTVESGAYLDRILYLRDTPAALRFVSYEPAIGPVEFRPYLKHSGLGWLIAGCESGPNARLALTDWFRSARDGCQENGVPFFLKQEMDRTGHLVKMPLLDGRQWAEMPEAQ